MLDTSSVITMERMFFAADFNGGISGWDTSSVENFSVRRDSQGQLVRFPIAPLDHTVHIRCEQVDISQAMQVAGWVLGPETRGLSPREVVWL